MRLLRRLRRWYCRTAHRDLWIHLPWGVICQKCGSVVTAWRLPVTRRLFLLLGALLGAV